jgi:hypothetical protein
VWRIVATYLPRSSGAVHPLAKRALPHLAAPLTTSSSHTTEPTGKTKAECLSYSLPSFRRRTSYRFRNETTIPSFNSTFNVTSRCMNLLLS